MKIPLKMHIQIREKNTGMFIDNISIIIIIFYNNTKNPFDIIPHASNSNGIITISKNEIINEMKKLMNNFIMDYKFPADNENPEITLVVMNQKEIESTIKYKQQWKHEDWEIEQLLKSKNNLYKPLTMVIPYSGEGSIEINIELEKQ